MITLNRTIISNNRVEFDCNYPIEWNSFLRNQNEFLFIEYDFDITYIPLSIINIPFVANMLCLAMFSGDEIEIDELDKDFYECIPNVIDGYRELYGERIKNVKIHCKKIAENKYSIDDNSPKVCAFTGGVDATSAVASHINENLILCNIWGGDIQLDNIDRHNAHEKYFREFAHRHRYKYHSIKSNFRFMYIENNIPYKFEHDWWAAVEHSIVIISTLMPLSYELKASKIYFGSSYTRKEFESNKTNDSNYVSIVNNMKYSSCIVEQCDENMNRTMKIKNIANKLMPTNIGEINILACWNHKYDTSFNCCSCEKCARTIMNILSTDNDPNLYGFPVTRDTYKWIEEFIQQQTNLNEYMWQEIIDTFKENPKRWKRDKRVKWILNYKVNCPPKHGFVYKKYKRIESILDKLVKIALKNEY